ncbi:MAG: HAD family hydrolase [Candidatus Saccharimonadales bacterium]
MRTLLLATDLDGTLIGDADSLKKLNEILSQLRHKDAIKLVYVTGRSLESYSQLSSEQSLLEPDALITAVGTEIYIGNSGRVHDWPNIDAWNADIIKQELASIRSLVPQPVSAQSEYKVSYYLEKNEGILELIKNKLHDMPVDILYSHERYLDILPKNAHKGSALKYLTELWDVSSAEVIACGDSANDIAMLQENKSIIVGNAQPELIEWVKHSKAEHFIATKPCALGILEGLDYYQVL